MLLQEEYLNRHKFNIPLIRYSEEGNIFFKNSDGEWIIMSIYWDESCTHPGSYNISYFQPLKDRSEFLKEYQSIECYWDEYEHYLRLWLIVNSDSYICQTEKEKKLFALEMFLFCRDSWIVDTLPMYYIDLLYKSTDTHRGIDERFIAYEEVYIELKKHHCFSVFEISIFSLQKNYMFWLARLSKNEKSYSHKNTNF